MRSHRLVESPLRWTEGGEGHPLAVSSRVRIARNLAGRPFPKGASDSVLDEVARQVLSALPCFSLTEALAVDSLDRLARRLLVERHLVSPPFSAGGRGRLVAVDAEGVVSLMVNEEDHLRIQVVLGGLDLGQASRLALSVHRALATSLDFAFDEGLGFLTACPTNVGTAMRASVMVHIPALELLGQIGALIQDVNRLGLTVRGTYGEGTKAQGALYQISNQVTLGPTEEELVEKVSAVARRIADEELRARRTLLDRRGAELEDRAWRAWGLLRYGRSLSFKEALAHLSFIHMAGALSIVPPLSASQWNGLVLAIQPAHLEARSGGDLSPAEQDRARSDLLRASMARKI